MIKILSSGWNRPECYKWASEQFSKEKEWPPTAESGLLYDCFANGQHRWHCWGGTFYFRDDADATLFLLRWGGEIKE